MYSDSFHPSNSGDVLAIFRCYSRPSTTFRSYGECDRRRRVGCSYSGHSLADSYLFAYSFDSDDF